MVGLWIPLESRDTRICQAVGYGVWRKGCKGRLGSFGPGWVVALSCIYKKGRLRDEQAWVG